MWSWSMVSVVKSQMYSTYTNSKIPETSTIVNSKWSSEDIDK